MGAGESGIGVGVKTVADTVFIRRHLRFGSPLREANKLNSHQVRSHYVVVCGLGHCSFYST
jgi:hypothetical protein